MRNCIILNKLDQTVYTGSILNVLDRPELFYIIKINKKKYRTHTKSTLAKLRFSS